MNKVFATGCKHVTAVLGTFILVLSVLSPAAFAQEKVKLELLHGWSGFREPMVQEMIDEFMREYPWIEVEARLVPHGELDDQFLLTYAAGMAPDVVMLTTKHVIAFADQGALVDLTPYIERDGIDWEIWVPSELEGGQWKGGTYGLPIRTGGEAGNILYYNKRLFAEAGLPSDSAPATWDDLMSYAKKLVRYDNENRIVLNPINDLTQGASAQATLNWIYSGGASLLSDDMRTIAFNSQAAADAMSFAQQFRSEVYRNPNDDKMGNDAFYSQQSAMFLWGSEGFSFVWDQDPDFPLGAGPRPKHPDSSYIGANQGTWRYVMSDSAADKEAAWLLIKWLTIREESGGWFIRAQGRPSPIRAYNLHPEYFEVNPLVTVVGDVLEQVANVPMLPIFDDIVLPVRNAFREVLAGTTAPGPALESAAQQAQAILDQYWAEVDAQKQ